MAIRTKRYSNGIILKPSKPSDISTSDSVNGLINYDSENHRLILKIAGVSTEIINSNQQQTLYNKTIDTNDNTIRVSATGVVATELDAALEEIKTLATNTGGAPINSPAFTGIPTVPTPVTSNNSNQIASTEYVTNKLNTVSTLEIGDVLLTYNSKLNFLECNGTFAYPKDYPELYNLGIKNSTISQTINNPSPVSNGSFRTLVWLTDTLILTSTRSASNNPYFTKFYVFTYNKSTNTLENPIYINSSWGLPTVTPNVLNFRKKIDNTLYFSSNNSTSGTYSQQSYFWTVTLSDNGEFISSQQVPIIGFNNSSGGTVGTNIDVDFSFYKYNNSIYALCNKNQDTTPVASVFKVLKLVSGNWIEISTNAQSVINQSSSINVNNNYVINYFYNTITSQTELQIHRIENEFSFSSHKVCLVKSFFVEIPTLNYINLDGVVAIDRTIFPNKLYVFKIENEILNSTSVDIVNENSNSKSYSEISFFKDLDLQKLYTLYGINNSQEFLIYSSDTISKNLFIYKVLYDGVLSLNLLDKIPYTYAVSSTPLIDIKGIIESEGNFNSFSGRIHINISKIQLPNIASPSSGLKYLIKAKV